MQLLDGKALAAKIRGEIKEEVIGLVANGGAAPHLAAVLVGDDGASQTYVRNKVKACEKVGFKSSLIRLGSETTEDQLLEIIKELNQDTDIDGFIVQLPLPKQISEDKVILAIDPGKDVDGFHPVNVGRMTLGLPAYISATPNGILKILERYKIKTSGMNCAVLGRSNIVGTPMGILLSRNAEPGNCTVTICHSRTKNLTEICAKADLIIAAIGIPDFVKPDMVKEGAIVVDVGITRVKDDSRKSGYRLVGDVDFEAVSPKCSWITPVPGGVGPMTVTSLLLNTLQAAKQRIS